MKSVLACKTIADCLSFTHRTSLWRFMLLHTLPLSTIIDLSWDIVNPPSNKIAWTRLNKSDVTPDVTKMERSESFRRDKIISFQSIKEERTVPSTSLPIKSSQNGQPKINSNVRNRIPPAGQNYGFWRNYWRKVNARCCYYKVLLSSFERKHKQYNNNYTRSIGKGRRKVS